MADLSSYAKAKDRLLLGAIGVVITLLGIMAADNRRLIIRNEQRIESLEWAHYSSMAERVTRLEEQMKVRDRYWRKHQEQNGGE